MQAIRPDCGPTGLAQAVHSPWVSGRFIVTTTPTGAARSITAGLLIALLAGAGAAQTPLAGSDGTLAFVRAAESYAFMHRRLERQLPPLEVNANPETIRRAIDAMAAAIRAARSDARQGDLFNPAAQATFRTRIATALRSHGLTAADVLDAERADAVEAPPATLMVNGDFPWRAATAMFPAILEALPPLPPELQYRIVGRDLILVDVHASLIVDILPRVLEPTETAGRGLPTGERGAL